MSLSSTERRFPEKIVIVIRSRAEKLFIPTSELVSLQAIQLFLRFLAYIWSECVDSFLVEYEAPLPRGHPPLHLPL